MMSKDVDSFPDFYLRSFIAKVSICIWILSIFIHMSLIEYFSLHSLVCLFPEDPAGHKESNLKSLVWVKYWVSLMEWEM